MMSSVIRGFGFNCFGEGKKGVCREGSSEFPNLIMSIKLLPEDWKTRLKRMNQKLDEDNGKEISIGN